MVTAWRPRWPSRTSSATFSPCCTSCLPGALQHGGMQEHILAAIVRRHEAEAAHLVEPLHRAVDGVGRAALVAVAEVAPRRRHGRRSRRRGRRSRRRGHRSHRRRRRRATAAEAAAAADAPKPPPRRRSHGAGGRSPKPPPPPKSRRGGRSPKPPPAAPKSRRGRRSPKPPRGAPRHRQALATLGDAGDETPALAVRADLADELVAGLGRLDASLGQCRSVEEHVLPVRAQHEAEALAGIVPLHLGLDGPGRRPACRCRKTRSVSIRN